MLACTAAFAQGPQELRAVDPIVRLDAQTGGKLANDRIEASWILREGHLGSLTIHDKAAPADGNAGSIVLQIPFYIELKNIGVLHAADLQVDGEARVEHLAPNESAARTSEKLPGVMVHYALSDPKGLFKADWALTLRQGSAYVRQTLTINAANTPVPLSSVAMIDTRIAGIALAGTVKGSPLTAGNFFLGFESPLSQSSVVGDRGVCELESGVPIGAGKSAQFSAVVGIAAQGQMRRAFLTYLERERAHPYRTFLHYNSWFDIGFFNPYTQQDALNRIHAIGDELNKKRGVTLDSLSLRRRLGRHERSVEDSLRLQGWL